MENIQKVRTIDGHTYTLPELRAAYDVRADTLAAIDVEIEGLRARREIVAAQLNAINVAAIRLISELEGGE